MLPTDIEKVVYNLAWGMEHSEKFEKCLEQIRRIKHRIFANERTIMNWPEEGKQVQYFTKRRLHVFCSYYLIAFIRSAPYENCDDILWIKHTSVNKSMHIILCQKPDNRVRIYVESPSRLLWDKY